MAFHFPVMPRLFMAIHMEDRFPIVDILQQTPPIPDQCQWAMFLRNHDELTLEMVTDEDRDYMYRTYAQDPQARINLGIRRRLAPLLDNDHARIELMNGLLLSLPGTPVLYYGDEIGMGDNIYLGDRNGVRTPMQWSADRNAGFSKTNPQRLYFPVISDPEYAYETVNVEAQQKNLTSLLWYVKRLIALRKRQRAFGRGSMEFLTPENARVLAFVRRYEDECLLVVANLSRFAQYVELDLSAYAGLIPVEMLGRTAFPAVGSGSYFLTLGPHAFYWFSLEPKRTAQEPPAEVSTLEAAGKWEALIEGDGKAALEEVLPTYLLGCRWYQQRGVLADTATIQEAAPLTYNGSVAYLTLVRLEFADHDDETYLLPLAFASGDQADHIRTELPHAVVARVRIRERRYPTPRGEVAQDRRSRPPVSGEGILFDPFGEEAFSSALVHAIASRRRLQRDGDQLLALPLPALKPLLDAGPLPRPALLRIEQTHTSIVFGDRLFLKLYRRIEVGVHPELELGRVLAERTTFRNVPTMVGTLELRPERAEPVALAILEAFVPNQGDAWRYTANALGRYYEHVLTRPGGAEGGPPPMRAPNDALAGELPPLARELVGGTIEDVRQLGRRVAEFHLALASVVDDPAFTPEPFTSLFQRSLYQSFRSQARKALETLRRRAKDLPEAAREDANNLLAREDEVLAAARKIYETKIAAQRTRSHGDLHLGQILVTGGDLVIIDLEGDARRPLSERRRKLSPLRDVASLMRSFHYAAFVALEHGRIRPEDARALRPWAYAWRFWVSTAFVRAYLEVAETGSFLPQDPGQRRLLLEFYLMKRAIYELRAELLTGLDRVRIPMEGLLQILDWYKEQA
jgi:maltose alpha-D-glucosyltransferase/alpha-amylase